MGAGVVCQTAPQYSLYMLNRYQFNPAFAGMDASLSVNAAYRTQWLDLPGNPEQQNLNAHMPLYLVDGAVGVSLSNESIGAEKTVSGSISYNYVFDTEFGLFSAGLSAGFLQKSLDGRLLRTPEGEYEGATINHLDGNLPNGLERGIAPTFALGGYYAGDLFEAGVAITDIVPGSVNLNESSSYQVKPTFNFFGEYFIESLDALKVYPSVFVKSDLIQTQAEVSVRAIYDNFISGGMSLRGYNSNTLDALVIFAGLRISDNLHLHYAFDLGLSRINQVSRGTHELLLNYNLNKIIGSGLPPRVIYNPRFL